MASELARPGRIARGLLPLTATVAWLILLTQAAPVLSIPRGFTGEVLGLAAAGMCAVWTWLVALEPRCFARFWSGACQRSGWGAWLALVSCVTAAAWAFGIGWPPFALGVSAIILCALLAAFASRRVRKAMVKAGLAAVSTVSALAIAEVGFRALLLRPMVPRTTPEFSRIIASRWPRPVPTSKPAGQLRILGLADSFGVWGGQSNFHPLLEKHLTAAGLSADVINVSEVEYGLPEKLEVLKRFGPRYRPDTILHSLVITNDFEVPAGELYTFRGASVRVLEGPEGWILRHLTLLQWRSKMQRFSARQEATNEELRRGERVGFLDRESFWRLSAPGWNGAGVWPPR